jgi:diketogulonate reductase-like aldo/keto reductase
MQIVKMNNSVEIPILGFGIFQITGGAKWGRSLLVISNELL